jgi:hypothetical protein
LKPWCLHNTGNCLEFTQNAEIIMALCERFVELKPIPFHNSRFIFWMVHKVADNSNIFNSFLCWSVLWNNIRFTVMVFDASYQSKLKDSTQRLSWIRVWFRIIYPKLRKYKERWFRYNWMNGLYCKGKIEMYLIWFVRCITTILANSEKEMWSVRVGWLVDGIIKINKRTSCHDDQLYETNETMKSRFILKK